MIDNCPICGESMILLSEVRTFNYKASIITIDYKSMKCLICNESFTNNNIEDDNISNIKSKHLEEIINKIIN